jgi:hypothetical protein
VQPLFQRPSSLDLLRQVLDASVTGGSDTPILQRAACPRSSCGRPLPCRRTSLAPNHPLLSPRPRRGDRRLGVLLDIECGRGHEHVSGTRISSMVGAAGAALGLVPFGCNVTARRSGALRAFADQSGVGVVSLGAPESKLRRSCTPPRLSPRRPTLPPLLCCVLSSQLLASRGLLLSVCDISSSHLHCGHFNLALRTRTITIYRHVWARFRSPVRRPEAFEQRSSSATDLP